MTAETHNDQRKGNSGFPFRRLILPAVFVLVLLLVTIFRDRPSPGPESAVWTFSGPTMGTEYSVKVVAPSLDDEGKLAIHQAIRREVDGIDDTMSTYKSQSELSLFNSGGTDYFLVSEGLFRVVAVALEVAEMSNGALDVTVGPLVDAWGFGPAGRVTEPADAEIDALRETVGWQKLILDRETRLMRKSIPDLRVDLSSIAKGFAVDRVLHAINKLGYHNVMVEVGGEVRTEGFNEFARPWRIGIERPDDDGRVVGVTVEISGGALATSGDYRNFRDVGGQRISHIIDPRTGRPVIHSLASVSVLSDSCMKSDAWATALTVLGPEQGVEIAEEQGLAALFVVRVDGGFDVIRTGDFSFEGIMGAS